MYSKRPPKSHCSSV